MKRRDFIRTSGAAAALLAAGCTPKQTESSMPAQQSIGALGIQLYTIRSMMRESVPETLTKVAAAGYAEVEFAGYFGHEPAAVRGMLDERGLRSPSTHVSLEALEEDVDAQFATANAIGQHYVVVPYLSDAYRSIEGYKTACRKLNEFGTRARDAGLEIAYHNHDFEFASLDGTVAYDLMLQELNPELVKMQLDLFWIYVGGKSAVEYLAKEPGRYVSCHIKDGMSDGADGSTQTVVGEGDLDFAAMFKAGSFKHYFVENDNPEDPESFIVESANYLKALRY